jgi:hypothetical protein
VKEKCDYCSAIASINIIYPDSIDVGGINVCYDCFLDMLSDGKMDRYFGNRLVVSGICSQVESQAKTMLSDRMRGEL